MDVDGDDVKIKYTVFLPYLSHQRDSTVTFQKYHYI